ncbi:MAG: hypothetical protein FJY85_05520 [Deltaproteobacteria bacterium]|nr:hypothetical protein [Deltaproteobacteria bacterium]
MSRDGLIDEILFDVKPIQPTHSDESRFVEFNPDLPLALAKDLVVAQLEKQYLSVVLERTRGAIGRAAAHAQVDARTIRRKMKQYGLEKSKFR